MGSKRKQKEKQKDFKKAKLKVGKTAKKPDNYTDTSFKAKTISLPGQSISIVHGSKDFTHQLSLLKHHSSTTRKEVVINITQNLPSNPAAYKLIISAAVPLILDESKLVRTEVMNLLKEIGRKQPGLLDLHKRSIVLFIISAMTHIQPDIRNTSTKFLATLLEYSDLKLYFVKILKNFFILMSWSLLDDNKSKGVSITTNSTILLGPNTKKARIDHLRVLVQFLKKNLLDDSEQGLVDADFSRIYTHPQTYKYLIPTTPQAFLALNLFGREIKSDLSATGSIAIQNLDTMTTEDIETRLNIMNDIFKDRMILNLKGLCKEGGEVGREASTCIDILEGISVK